MVNSPNDLSQLTSDTVLYKPSNLTSWVDSLLSDLTSSVMEFWVKVNWQWVAMMESVRAVEETTKIQWRIGLGEKPEAKLDEPRHC
ncbi:hypothetical protein Pyn_18747 [Prunus yedoensis var. nudiflora]|uniref:Transcriptional factor DELLA N-terminal domain-containing protein n=1 Tax=Prunus yedoensis var. nudiflora TaxID=2094558 RepID=A0A314XQI2_PRUYE|nr:hypothetical protein Pyn_18747 [Prunus yedoensis var. nudiflora]